MVLTVEPGIYFNDFQMDKGLANPLQAQFLVKERIDGLRTFGGARIEDMVRAPISFALEQEAPSETCALAGACDCNRDRAADDSSPRHREGGGDLPRRRVRPRDWDRDAQLNKMLADQEFERACGEPEEYCLNAY